LNKEVVSPENVVALFKNNKNNEERLKVYLFRLIAIFCKTVPFRKPDEIKYPLDLKPTVVITNMRRNLARKYKVGEPAHNMHLLEKEFYLREMTDVHPEKGNIDPNFAWEYEMTFPEEEEIEEKENQDPAKETSNESNSDDLETSDDEQKDQPAKKKVKAKTDDPCSMPEDFGVADFPHANARKRTNNKFNVIYNESTVFRGPYQGTNRQHKTFEILRSIGLEKRYPDIVLLVPKRICRDPKNGGYWMQYPNLAVVPQEQWEKTHQSDCDPKMSLLLEIVDPISMGIQNYANYILSNQEDFVEKHCIPIMVTLMWLALLHIDHRGFDNILLVNGKLVFLDFDQYKNKKPLRPTKEDELTPDFAFSKGVQQLKPALESAFVKAKETLKKELTIMEEMLDINNIDDSTTEEEILERMKQSPLGNALSNNNIEIESVLSTYQEMFGNVFAE
jgi:hypothetical protein